MPSAKQDGCNADLAHAHLVRGCSLRTGASSCPYDGLLGLPLADRSKLLSLRILQHLGCFVQVRACLGCFPSFAKAFYHLKMIPKIMP